MYVLLAEETLPRPGSVQLSMHTNCINLAFLCNIYISLLSALHMRAGEEMALQVKP